MEWVSQCFGRLSLLVATLLKCKTFYVIFKRLNFSVVKYCQVKLLDRTLFARYNMHMNKLEFMRLWDLYGGLLTPTQREMTNAYFNLDLTVSEIAEQKGVSRQAVSECLSQCKKQLAGYENVLHHNQLLTEGALRLSFVMTDALRWADKFLSSHPEYAEDISELKGVLTCDYAERISAAMAGANKS